VFRQWVGLTGPFVITPRTLWSSKKGSIVLVSKDTYIDDRMSFDVDFVPIFTLEKGGNVGISFRTDVKRRGKKKKTKQNNI
jgi:hypothetical protein